MVTMRNHLSMVLFSIILTACGTSSDESSLQGSSSPLSSEACVEKLWPKKENFKPLTTANDLFECVGKRVQLQLQNQDIDITAELLIPDHTHSRLTHTQKSPLSRKLFSIGIVEPCYFQQKYNRVPTSEGKRPFIFDTMIDCIVKAAFEHWKYGSIIAHAQTITKTRVSITPLPATMMELCVVDYQRHATETRNALPRLQSLQECLFKTIHDSPLIKKENPPPTVSEQEVDPQLLEEEQEALKSEILINEKDITMDAKTLKVLEACVGEYKQSKENIDLRTEKLIDCTINSIYQRMKNWNVHIKANIMAFSNQDQFQGGRDLKFDFIIPLWNDEEDQNMLALQPGFLLSIYSHDDPLLQGSVGVVYRLSIMHGIVGFNIFNDVQVSGSKGSHRLSIGADYQNDDNYFSANYYPPLSEWIDLDEHRKKRQIHGFDLGITKTLSDRFYISTILALWSNRDGEGTLFFDGTLGYNLNCQTALEAGLSYDTTKQNVTGHFDISIQLDTSSQDPFSQNCSGKNPSYSIRRRVNRANNLFNEQK